MQDTALDGHTLRDVSLAAPTSDENSKSALTERMRSGRLRWTGPTLLVIGRNVFMIAAQAIAASLIWLQTHSWSWNGAAKWWTVYGTLVDIGCLALMSIYVRKEGIRLRDLVGPIRMRMGRDFFLGLACLILLFPCFALAAPPANRVIYASMQPPSFAGTLTDRVLPLWGIIYSFSVWWLVWSPTEEMTYQGYALPRLEVLCGNRWMAIAIVSFFWTLQHDFLPFILDWKYLAWRFIAFLPGVIIFTLLYMRIRRLPPLILAHWSMDIFAVFLTLRR